MGKFMDLILGKYPNPKFKVGDIVTYPSDMFKSYTLNKSEYITGKVKEVHKLSRGVIPYYWVESEELKIDGKILPLGLPEDKLK